MAVKWSVTPTEGAENLGGGKFKFTPPSSGSKVYTITYDDGKSDPATTTYTVSAGECVTCNCSKITSFTPSVTSIDASGGPMELARLKLSSDFCKDNTKMKFVNKEHVDNFIVEDAESSDLEKVIKGTVEPNDTAQPRQVKFVVEFYGSPCSDKAAFSKTQAQGCNCDNYTFTKVDNIPYFSDAQKQVKIGTISSNNSGCGYDGITFTCDSSLLVSTAITSNTVYATLNKNDEDDPVTITFTMKYNGTTCSSYAITMLGETRVCMIDNCADDDLFTNVHSNLHVLPMGFRYATGDEEGTCDTAHWKNAFTDYEVVSMEFKDLDMYSDNKYAYVNTTDGWQTVTDQIRIETNSTGCQNSHYCPGNLGCDYLYKRNPSATKVRWFRIKWGWKPNTWSNASTCNTYEGIPAGTHYKKESWVIGMLAPNGYHWEDANPKYDTDNRHTYKLVEGFG